jgi:predicted NBD/HSP70 family sugar kinase
MTKIVFDMGATNTRVARADKGELSEILKRPTPALKGEWGEHLILMINEAAKGEEVERVVGGVASIEGKELVAAALPNARIYNDALLAGLGEAVRGAGRDKEIVGYVGLGTGIGTARIAYKNLDVDGFEAGHHIIDSLTGESWEEKVSGRTLEARHGKYPQDLDEKDYKEYANFVAMGVYNAILFWSPEVLVMGGALINEKDGFKVEDISVYINSLNKDLPVLPPIIKSELGDSAGLYGAMAILENEEKAG